MITQKVAYVYADGPYSSVDFCGEEVPVYYVSTMADEDDEIETVCVRSADHAEDLGQKLARKHGVEFVCEVSLP